MACPHCQEFLVQEYNNPMWQSRCLNCGYVTDDEADRTRSLRACDMVGWKTTSVAAVAGFKPDYWTKPMRKDQTLIYIKSGSSFDYPQHIASYMGIIPSSLGQQVS